MIITIDSNVFKEKAKGVVSNLALKTKDTFARIKRSLVLWLTNSCSITKCYKLGHDIYIIPGSFVVKDNKVYSLEKPVKLSVRIFDSNVNVVVDSTHVFLESDPSITLLDFV